MKRKIGKLNNIPIVEGDKNLVKRGGAEIHINDLQGKDSSSGSSSKYAPRYFSIDFNAADEGWKYLLSINDAMNPICEDNIVVNIGATYKIIVDENNKMITTYPFMANILTSVTQFSYVPLYIPDSIAGSIGIKGGFLTFEDIITNMPKVLIEILEKEITLSMNGITEITEEEFYTL